MNKTKKIIVTVESTYEPGHSDPVNQKFFWSYQVFITNDSTDIVQLLNRYWLITDMSGRTEEVRGAGVVGLQPLIKPGKHFTYISFCQLTTPQGTMEGHYEIQNLDDERFKVEIPKFVLSAPTTITQGYKSKLH